MADGHGGSWPSLAADAGSDPEEAAVTTAETGAADAPPAQTGAQARSLSTSLRAGAPDPQILHLLHAVLALNEQHRPFVLQIIASVAGEGTSHVAASLAETAVRQIGLPVLRLDCNPPSATASGEKQPPSLIDAFRTSSLSETALRSLAPNLLLARLSNAADGVYGMSPADLQLLFDALRKRFAMVVLDCPPALSSPGAVGLARYCDGTALVVRADTTPRAMVAQARTAIDRFGGQVIGVILNRRRSHLPSWARRWF